MNHTITKDELRRPDQLTALGLRLFQQLLQNQKLVFGVLGGLAVLGLASILWTKLAENKEVAVQEQFYAIEKTFLKKQDAFQKGETEKTGAANKKTDAAKGDAGDDAVVAQVASGDLSKDYGVEVEEWNKLIAAHPGSKGAAMAALEMGQLLVKYGKKEEALQLLAKVKNQQNSEGLLGAMVFHAYASMLADQGQCSEAVSVWENLEKRKAMGFMVEQAQYGRALCFESMGQAEKAELLLNDIVAEKPKKEALDSEKGAPPRSKTQIQRSAEKYLRYLQVKKAMKAT